MGSFRIDKWDGSSGRSDKVLRHREAHSEAQTHHDFASIIRRKETYRCTLFSTAFHESTNLIVSSTRAMLHTYRCCQYIQARKMLLISPCEAKEVSLSPSTERPYCSQHVCFAYVLLVECNCTRRLGLIPKHVLRVFWALGIVCVYVQGGSGGDGSPEVSERSKGVRVLPTTEDEEAMKGVRLVLDVGRRMQVPTQGTRSTAPRARSFLEHPHSPVGLRCLDSCRETSFSNNQSPSERAWKMSKNAFALTARSRSVYIGQKLGE